jgi:hypothetical protein
MYASVSRTLAILAALSSLALMVYAARPWGDDYAYQGWRGYAGLLLMMAWATLPYLGIVLLARQAVHGKAGEILVLVGALIVTVGGLAAYVEAIWLHPDPQGGLAFIVVPFYQAIILGLLAVLLWLVKKRQTF